MAAKVAAPDDIPTSNPSVAASWRVVAKASSFFTLKISSIIEVFNIIFEDILSEAVIRQIMAQSGRSYQIANAYNGRGNGFIIKLQITIVINLISIVIQQYFPLCNE